MIHAENCLILEDNPLRYPYLVNLMFEICYPNVRKLVIVTTAEAAKRELSDGSMWNVIMLDHDLDGKVYTDSEEENNGYQVAKFMVEAKVKYELCIVHTLNDYAVPKMLKVLKDGTGKAIYKPCVDL